MLIVCTGRTMVPSIQRKSKHASKFYFRFRQYSEAVIQCINAAEKYPLHTQLKQCILCIIERLLAAGINLSMQKKTCQSYYNNLCNLCKSSHLFHSSIQHRQWLAVHPLYSPQQEIKHSTLQCDTAKITLIKLGTHSVHMPIQLNSDCIYRCNTRM